MFNNDWINNGYCISTCGEPGQQLQKRTKTPKYDVDNNVCDDEPTERYKGCSTIDQYQCDNDNQHKIEVEHVLGGKNNNRNQLRLKKFTSGQNNSSEHINNSNFNIGKLKQIFDSSNFIDDDGSQGIINARFNSSGEITSANKAYKLQWINKLQPENCEYEEGEWSEWTQVFVLVIVYKNNLKQEIIKYIEIRNI